MKIFVSFWGLGLWGLGIYWEGLFWGGGLFRGLDFLIEGGGEGKGYGGMERGDCGCDMGVSGGGECVEK